MSKVTQKNDGDPVEPEKPKTQKARLVAAKKCAPKKIKIEIPVITDYKNILSVVAQSEVGIAFPTYGHASTVKTWKHFPEHVAHAYVEPQEMNTYKQLHEGQAFHIYEKNGMPISEKRKYIVDDYTKMGIRWLFMLEDDLTGFFVRDDETTDGFHKLVKSDYKTVMDGMLNFAIANNIALLGLSQQQSNLFYEETHVKYSCKVTEFVLLDLDALKEANVNYDPALEHFEDFDIEIQLLQKGLKVGLYTPAAFGHVAMGTNAGGHQIDGSRKESTKASIEAMIIKYPGIVEYLEVLLR